MRAISNDPKKMFLKRTHLWEFNVNEKTSLCEHSNECIDIKPLDTYDEMNIHIKWGE